ncbi:carbohydrate ABC transporter permease [Cohnella sp. 56]|uniref:carbohydrate ABC transporter permease n=1 Tax=Cohnella sp. 56 TaxID=3113722 RepID=UPI0030EA2FF6
MRLPRRWPRWLGRSGSARSLAGRSGDAWRSLRRIDGTQWALMAALLALAAFMMLPIVYLFNQALKPYHELFLFPPTYFAKDPTLLNFTDLLNSTNRSFIPFSRLVFNTVLVTVVTAAGMIATSAFCAYALSKHPFPGNKALFTVVLLSLMFVPETMEIPRYIVVQYLGIMNTYWAHILPVISLPVGVFLLKQFIDQVPGELIEAAKIDGAGETGTFLRIVVPVIMPALATVGILAFQNVWGNLETSKYFMQDEAMKTLTFFLSTLTQNLANSVAMQGVAAAGALIIFLPQLIIFIFFQRKVIATMAHSGIK